MVNQNVTIASDTVVVSGGAQDISVDVNFGGRGNRGGLILYGLGKPTDPGVVFPNEPQLLDWYINIDNSDEEYLYIYQFVYKDATTSWVKLFSIIPNIYQTNKEVAFDNGLATVNLPISNTTLPLVPLYSYPDSSSTVIPVTSESEMLSLAATAGTYAYRLDLAKFFYLASTPASNLDNWNGLLAVNAHINILSTSTSFFNTIMSSFRIGVPQININESDSSYSFVLPIEISAAELQGSSIVPLSGNWPVHITLNMI